MFIDACTQLNQSSWRHSEVTCNLKGGRYNFLHLRQKPSNWVAPCQETVSFWRPCGSEECRKPTHGEQNIDLINVKSMACSHVHPIGAPMHQCVFRSLGRLDALLRREDAAWAIKRYQWRLAEVSSRIGREADLVAVVRGENKLCDRAGPLGSWRLVPTFCHLTTYIYMYIIYIYM